MDIMVYHDLSLGAGLSDTGPSDLLRFIKGFCY